jgi:PAS domain S-box-containing protein
LTLSLQPDIETVFFVSDDSKTGKSKLETVRQLQPAYKEKVGFKYLSEMRMDELQAALRRLPKKSAVFDLIFIRDSSGKVFSIKESSQMIGNSAGVPVYRSWGFQPDTSIMGGHINTGFVHGKKTVQIALKLLNNEEKLKIPSIQKVDLLYMFDYRVMKRFNIGIKDIPENSVVYNKPFSIYEKYRWHIVGIVVFVILQTILILFLVLNRSMRRRSEQELKKSEVKYRNLVDNSIVGVFHSRLNGGFIFSNDALAQILDFDSPEQMVAEGTLPRWSNPNQREQWLAALQEQGSVRNFEMEAITHTSRKIHLLFSANLNADNILGMVMDITKRKQTEEALKDSEEKFRNLMEQSPFSIQIIKPDGRVDQFNKAFMELWGISEETLPEVLERYNVLEDEEARKLGVIPLIEKAIRGEAVILPEIEYDASRTMENLDIVGTDSKKLWIQARLYPVKNKKGEVTNVVFIEEDITDRKQAEEKINNYQERLKALASQLTVTEEKERRRIAVDLHDQIGQSLALARIQIAAAKKSAADDGLAAKLDDVSEILRSAVQDTRHLIFDLSPPAMHEIGLGAAISEWIDDQIGKRYGLKTEFFDNIDQSYRKTLDENVRAILFRNVRELLINTVKHAQANQVSVSMEITNGLLKIVVRDDGVGFKFRSELQSVKLDGSFGLFSIKERMADLGGTLEIESEPGKGCTVILSMPLDSGLASGS